MKTLEQQGWTLMLLNKKKKKKPKVKAVHDLITNNQNK